MKEKFREQEREELSHQEAHKELPLLKKNQFQLLKIHVINQKALGRPVLGKMQKYSHAQKKELVMEVRTFTATKKI